MYDWRGAGILVWAPRRNVACALVFQDKTGAWAPPGGMRDKRDRTPLETAMREFIEEAGEPDYPLTFTGVSPDPKDKSVVYTAEADAVWTPRLSPEHVLWSWVTPGELRRLRLRPFMRRYLDRVDGHTSSTAW